MFKMPNTSRKHKIALKNVHHFKNAKTTSAKSIELHTKLYQFKTSFPTYSFCILKLMDQISFAIFCYNCFFARNISPNSQNINFAKTIHAERTILIKVLDSQFQVSFDFMFSSLFRP
jgi:hypothetical protein